MYASILLTFRNDKTKEKKRCKLRITLFPWIFDPKARILNGLKARGEKNTAKILLLSKVDVKLLKRSHWSHVLST